MRDTDDLSAQLALKDALHACPELAGQEGGTAEILAGFLRGHAPDQLITGLGGAGVAAVFDGQRRGPTVLVRADMDALPIDAAGAAAAHRCGHDGHMAAVAGLAFDLGRRRPACGRVVLLFQPAEETGEGAAKVIADPRFEALRPDYALALHNLPGAPAGQIVSREGVFACASVGLRVSFDGTPAHAAEPHLANPPTPVLAEIFGALPRLAEPTAGTRLTITHARLGQPSFGITPGDAVVLATLRAERTAALAQLRASAAQLVLQVASAQALSVRIEWLDEFPATVNDAALVRRLGEICAAEGWPLARRDQPFGWSEDFGHFGAIAPSLYFGLGTGVDLPGLHQSDYRFPPELVGVGTRVFAALAGALTSSV